MERYWLNIILSNNIDIDYENIYNQYKNLRSISSYISNYKIDFKKKFKNDNEDVNVNVNKNKNEDENKNINLNKNMNENEHVCDCVFNNICITKDLNKFKKCNNFNNFINKNPILELLFVKKKVDFSYIPNTNILEGEYKNEIISNVRNHMDFINIIHCEKKIVFIISMFDCLIKNYYIVKNNSSLFKVSLEKLYEIDNCNFLINSLKNYDIDQNVFKNIINMYTQNI